MKNAKCKYGCLQSNTIMSLRFGGSCLPPHCCRLTQTQLNITFFLLYGSPFLFMILAVSYRKYRKKNWLLKNYYSCKLFWPCRSIERQGQTTLSINSKPLGFLIALSFFFPCKTKTKLRNVTESEYKKMYKCLCFPDTYGYLFSPRVHHGSISSECE